MFFNLKNMLTLNYVQFYLLATVLIIFPEYSISAEDSESLSFSSSDDHSSDESSSSSVTNSNVDSVSFKKKGGLINMYVHGYSENNGKPHARAGVGVWFNHKHPLNTFKPVKNKPTNINADLEAALLGIKIAINHDIDEVMIHTDSSFVINCMTKWIKNWKKNGWKTMSGFDVKNKDTIKKLDKAIKEMEKVHWVLVKGPDSEVGCIEADALAQKGASQYKVKERTGDNYGSKKNYNKNNYRGGYNNQRYNNGGNGRSGSGRVGQIYTPKEPEWR